MKPIRIMLADDHGLFRAGLFALLDKKSVDFEIVAEADNGRQALRLIADKQPDVVLMDIAMPELNGLDATARAASKFPNVHVVVLSMSDSQEFVVHALQAGAAGYLLKNVTPEELELAIRAAARGEIYLCAGICKHVVNGCLAWSKATASAPDLLTPRQREVLQLIAEGTTTKGIAKKLGIAVKTAESYRSELMEALDIHDVAGLTRYAIRTRLITPDV
jgi:DNA-binding NarL/FixJ family response regulator